MLQGCACAACSAGLPGIVDFGGLAGRRSVQTRVQREAQMLVAEVEQEIHVA